MDKIVQFPKQKPGRKPANLRQRLQHCKWDELEEEEQLFAIALCGLLGLPANRWINADIVSKAGLARDKLC